VLALFSPIADPARLSVADQVARLRSGRVPVESFDFAYLRFDGARYGREALETLKSAASGERAPLIMEKAEAALRLQSRGGKLSTAPQPQDIAANVTAYPQGRILPEAFVRQNWNAEPVKVWSLPQCLTDKSHKCDAFFVDLDADGVDDIVLVEPGARSAVFNARQAGTWEMIGTWPYSCPKVIEALRAGNFKAVPPVLNDVEIDGHRLHLEPVLNQTNLCD
jgi:hypothetical protein